MRSLSLAILSFSASMLLPSVPCAADKEPKKLPPGVAQLISGSPEAFIKHFDRNKLGYLTKDELPPRLANVFDKFDANSDGKLSKSEVQEMLIVLRQRFGVTAGKPSRLANRIDAKQVDRLVDRMLERMDKDKDGKISQEEAQGPLANQFDRLDVNKDGYLDRTELRRAAERFLQSRGRDNDKASSGKTPKPQADFDALDSNADGRLSREELEGTPFATNFDEIDTNKDGKIDRKEFEAYLHRQTEKKPQ